MTPGDASAEVRTPVDRPSVVAAAIRPDNTTELDTRVEDGAIVTAIDRDDVGGLASTLDDYLVNLTVATEVTVFTTDTNHE